MSALSRPETDPPALRFLRERALPGHRVWWPSGSSASPETASEGSLPDWALVEPSRPEAVPDALLRRLLAQATPVHADPSGVVFARRPTLGLADRRDAPEVRAIAEHLARRPAVLPAAGETLAARPQEPAEESGAAPSEPPPAVSVRSLPPEALAARRLPLTAASAPQPRGPPTLPAETSALPEAAIPLQVSGADSPPPSEPAPSPAPPRSSAPAPHLLARALILLPPVAGRRVAALGRSGSLARALPGALPSEGENLPAGCFDLALLLPEDAEALEAGAAEAARLLAPGGVLLVAAENAHSLGRRLAAALDRPAPPGLSADQLRAALRAQGLAPLTLEGHGLDAWRAGSDHPPPGLGEGKPAAALLEAAGYDAGPAHAATLIVTARRPG